MEIGGFFMSEVKVVAVHGEMVTAYGWGVDAAWQGLCRGQTAISDIQRFDTHALTTPFGGVIADLDPRKGSLIMQMIVPLLESCPVPIPHDAALFLATINGEIHHVERSVLDQTDDADRSRPDDLLHRIGDIARVEGPQAIVSAACTSSATAIAYGASQIRAGALPSALIVGCDQLSEFVLSGFSALMALDPERSKPFDVHRRGLSIGEGAGYLLIMDEARARKDGLPILGEVAGWGLAADANHMTGPDREGKGLAAAMTKALKSADISPTEVGSIAAHGSGTPYNDSMEMKAIKKVFGSHVIPAYSIKGGTGHTLGGAGLIEALVALKSMEEEHVPPTVNLTDIDPEAHGWVQNQCQQVDRNVTLSSNAGFGGINSALVLRRLNGR